MKCALFQKIGDLLRLAEFPVAKEEPRLGAHLDLGLTQNFMGWAWTCYLLFLGLRSLTCQAGSNGSHFHCCS